MARDVSITIGAEWRDIEPTGEACWGCGDMCLLREVAFFTIIGTFESDTGFHLCGSCADGIEEE